MDQTQPDRTELFIRYIRRSLFLALGILGLLALWLAQVAFDSTGVFTPVMRGLVSPFPLLPLVIGFAVVLHGASLKGARFTKEDPDVRAVLDDEHRRGAFDRAFRAAFVALLALQAPLAGLFLAWPVAHAPLFMAAFSVVLGVMALLGAFLVLDRG